MSENSWTSSALGPCPIDVSIVMPCLDEEQALPVALASARAALDQLSEAHGLNGEIIVADNGSADGSRAVAAAAGARVVLVSRRGYGAALTSGFQAAHGRYLVMGAADGSYDFRDAVASLPRAMSKGDRASAIAARLAQHHDHDTAKVSPASVKKRIGFLQAMIGMAAKQRWIDINPATGVEIENYSKTVRNRRPFRDDELRFLFAAPLFTDPTTWDFSRSTVSDATLVWAFLLGLTSGARLEEIGQTLLVNIKTDGAVCYLDLGVDAQVETETSSRTLPIHRLVQSQRVNVSRCQQARESRYRSRPRR